MQEIPDGEERQKKKKRSYRATADREREKERGTWTVDPCRYGLPPRGASFRSFRRGAIFRQERRTVSLKNRTLLNTKEKGKRILVSSQNTNQICHQFFLLTETIFSILSIKPTRILIANHILITNLEKFCGLK